MAITGSIYSLAKKETDLTTKQVLQNMMSISKDTGIVVMDGRSLAAGSIFGEQIHANAITADHIKAGAIETDHMDAGTIDVSVLKGSQLILPGANYGGVVINKDGLTMKSTGTAKLDIKLSSDSGFNITDGNNNQLIDIDPKTGNVRMQVNQLTIGKDSAATTEDINNIEVGGRNLLLDSDREWASPNSFNFSADVMGDTHRPMKEGETYTFSFEAKSDDDSDSNRIYLNNGITIWNVIEFPNEWTKQYVTFVYDGSLFQNRQIYPHFYTMDTFKKYLRRPKLEKGNKATDWTPAPEDIQNEIDSRPTFNDFDQTDKVTINGGNIKAGTISSKNSYSRISLEDGSFSFGDGRLVWDGSDMTVNGTISVNNIDGPIPKSKLESSVQGEIDAGNIAKTKTDKWTYPGTTLIGGDFIQTGTMSANRIKANTITANEIESKTITTEELNITTLSAITANLGTVTAGTIRSKDDAININLDTGTINLSRPLTINHLAVSTKEEVEDAIQNIEIGGRNLVLDSYWDESNSEYLFKEFQTSEPLIVGDVYTLRIYGDLAEEKNIFAFYSDIGLNHFKKLDGTTSGGNLVNLGNGIYETTFIYHFNDEYEPNRHDVFRIYAMTSAEVGESYIEKIKLERGNISTDWTEAPEDTQAMIDGKAGTNAVDEIQDSLNEWEGLVAKKDELREIVTAVNDIADGVKAEGEVSDAISKKVEDILKRVPVIEQNYEDRSLQWNFVDSYMEFSDDGMLIRHSDGSSGILINKDEIAFIDSNNKPVADITNDRMRINRGIFADSVRVGQHEERDMGDGHTITVWVGDV